MPEILGRDNMPLTEANADYVHKDLDSPNRVGQIRCQLTMTVGDLEDGEQVDTELRGATSPEDFKHFMESIGRVAGRLVLGSQRHEKFNPFATASIYHEYIQAFGDGFKGEIGDALKGEK
jgi:hypothetical protein